MQTLVDHHSQVVDDAITNRKSVEFTQDRSDVSKLPGLCRDTSCVILNSLKLFSKPLFTPYSKLLQ